MFSPEEDPSRPKRERWWRSVFIVLATMYVALLLAGLLVEILGGFTQILLIVFTAWLLAFVLAVVSVPGPSPLALGALLCVAALVLLGTGVPPRHLAPRLLVGLPVVVFALLLPFVATGPDRSVGPVLVSEAGLAAAWTVLAKGLTGVLAAVAFGFSANEVIIFGIALNLVAGRLREEPSAALAATYLYHLTQAHAFIDGNSESARARSTSSSRSTTTTSKRRRMSSMT